MTKKVVSGTLSDTGVSAPILIDFLQWMDVDISNTWATGTVTLESSSDLSAWVVVETISAADTLNVLNNSASQSRVYYRVRWADLDPEELSPGQVDYVLSEVIEAQYVEEAVTLTSFTQADAIKDALPDTADGTTLGLSDDVGDPVLGSTVSGAGTASASETAGLLYALPAKYKAGSDVKVTIRAKSSDTFEVAQTIDVSAYVVGDTLSETDLCATSAITLTESYADCEFSLTATDLEPADALFIQVTAAADDTAGANSGAISIVGAKITYGV